MCGDSEKGGSQRKDVASFTLGGFAQYVRGVGTLKAQGGDLGGGSETIVVEPSAYDMTHACDVIPAVPQVRRLTPIECERLQGFPDNWTQIPYRGKAKENCPDAPRYKAIGNSWAVPVVRWIGRRIKENLK